MFSIIITKARMLHIRSLLVICCCFLFLSSCKTGSRSEDNVDSIQMDLSVENLDQALFACRSVKDVQIFLEKHAYLTPLYFTDSPVGEGQLAAHLFEILQNPDLQKFRMQLDSIIGDRNSTIIDPLTEAFKRIKYFYPAFKAPEIKFMVTGFTGNDLYVSDSLIIIGLDYFGGADAMYRPNVFDYQLSRYRKEYIVPSVIFFLSNNYDRLDAADHTLLADMVAFGKSYRFVKEVLPQAPDSIILNFSDQQLKRTYSSQGDIWRYFIAGKLLYEKNDLMKQKYIGERPFTTEIGSKVPGGIGRWIGWRIVNRYMAENPDLTLPELMQENNAVNLLQASGYKGQKDDEE